MTSAARKRIGLSAGAPVISSSALRCIAAANEDVPCKVA